MIAQNTMKMNGKWYKAGEEISLAKPQEEVKQNQYTKTEINRMSTADLKELAEKNGLDNSLSGAELKKLLINHYGL